MESTFFTDAAKFIRETMDACAYAERAESHLVEMEKRWNENTMNEVDLYFLKNLGVLLRCALQDFGCNDTNQRRKNSNSDRNCMEKERKTEKLESLLPGIIQKFDIHLATQSFLPPAVHLTSKLEQARNEAQMLERSLDQIIYEIKGESGDRKRPFGSTGSMDLCLQALKSL